MAKAQYYSVPEAAEYMGKTARAIWSDVYRGKIPYKRCGGRVLIPIAELEKFLDLLPGVSAEAAAARVERARRITANPATPAPAKTTTVQQEAAALLQRRKAA